MRSARLPYLTIRLGLQPPNDCAISSRSHGYRGAHSESLMRSGTIVLSEPEIDDNLQPLCGRAPPGIEHLAAQSSAEALMRQGIPVDWRDQRRLFDSLR